ncbi:hypothetical protein Tco_0821942, partial [Tanacetum coccineum]
SMDCVHRIVIEHFQKYGKFSAEATWVPKDPTKTDSRRKEDIVNASLLGYIVVAIVTVVTMLIMRGPKVADSLWLTNPDGSLFNIRYIDRVVMLISKSITDEMGSALIVACQRISSTIWRSGLTSSVPRGRWDPSYDVLLAAVAVVVGVDDVLDGASCSSQNWSLLRAS